jgi:hypothetical protein
VNFVKKNFNIIFQANIMAMYGRLSDSFTIAVAGYATVSWIPRDAGAIDSTEI